MSSLNIKIGNIDKLSKDTIIEHIVEQSINQNKYIGFTEKFAFVGFGSSEQLKCNLLSIRSLKGANKRDAKQELKNLLVYYINSAISSERSSSKEDPIGSTRRSLRIQDNESKQTPRVYGLKNLGNTCYLNSVLQLLFSSNTMINSFEQQKHNAHLVSVKQSEIALFNSFLEILNLNSTMISNKHNSIVPLNFFKLFSTTSKLKKKKIWGNEQQDALEFLNDLLDYFDRAYDLIGSISFTRQTIEMIFNQLIMCGANNFHQSSQSIQDLVLKLDVLYQDTCLERLVELYFAPVNLNEFFCSLCKCKQNSTMNMKLMQLNSVLLICLKRYMVC